MDLASYIQDMIKKGYDIPAIRNYLLRYGYPQAQVDQAIYLLDHKPGFHITKNMMTITSVILVVVIFSFAFYIFFSKTNVPEQLLDVSIQNVDSQISPGNRLSISYILTNMGSNKRYDVYLKYEVFDQRDNSRLAWSSETLALDQEKTQIASVDIPDDAAPGDYIIQITARYNAQTAKTTSQFKIGSGQSLASCHDGIKNQDESDIDCGGVCKACQACPASCNDNDALTIDSCDASTGFRCLHEHVAKCGDDICETTENINTCPDDCNDITPPADNVWDELDKIKELASKDASAAQNRCTALDPDYKDLCLENVGTIALDAGICDKIENDYHKDRCFSLVAKNLKKSAICENVQSSKRDTCYGYFVIDGDYSVCDKIENQYLKKNCNILKQAAQ